MSRMVDDWERDIEKYGLEFALSLQEKGHGDLDENLGIAIRKAQRKQEDKRQTTTLTLATEANDLAKKANREMRWTWVVGAVVAIFLAWLANQP